MLGIAESQAHCESFSKCSKGWATLPMKHPAAQLARAAAQISPTALLLGPGGAQGLLIRSEKGAFRAGSVAPRPATTVRN